MSSQPLHMLTVYQPEGSTVTYHYAAGTTAPEIGEVTAEFHGPLTGRFSEFSSLQAGRYTQQGGRMFVTDIFAPLRAEAKRDLVGILGYPFLGDGNVTFDFPNSRLSVTKL